jgi:hypothetical protein
MALKVRQTTLTRRKANSSADGDAAHIALGRVVVDGETPAFQTG